MSYSWWIVCVIIIFQIAFLRALNVRYRCDLGGETARPRDVYHNGQVRSVTLQESNRIQHKLINAVLGILLTEKMGYKNVTTVPEVRGNLTTILQALSIDKFNQWPEQLINAEVYVPPGYRFDGYISRAGITGTNSGGYSWWLYSPSPLDTIQCAFAKDLIFYAYPEMIDDCYRGQEFLKASDPVLRDYETFYNKNCTTCRSIVVLSTYKNETYFLKEHVENLNISASVIWLEHKFNTVLDNLKNSRNETFFIVDNISWPKLIKITSNCENIPNTSSCPYKKLPYSKVVSNYVYFYTPKIINMIQELILTEAEIRSLIIKYRNEALNRSERDIEKAACAWLKSESNAAKIKLLAPAKMKEIMLYVFTCKEETSHKVLGRVAYKTRDYINREKILNGIYELKLINVNVTCYGDGLARTVKVFVDILRGDDYRKLGGIVLPAIPQALDIVAGLSRPWQTSLFVFNSDGPSFAKREKYPYVFRMVGEKMNLKQAYLELCRQYGWSRVAAVSGYNQNNAAFISFLGQYLSAYGMKFTYEKIAEDKSIVWKALESLHHQNARIIIVDVDSSLGEELLLMAYELRMLPTEGYVWILPDWAPSLYATLKTSNKNKAENIKKVLDGHFSLTFSSIKETRDNDESDSIASFRQDLLDQISKEHANDYSKAGFVADAIWTFAIGMKQFMERHPGAEYDIHGTMQNLSSYIEKQQPFEGVSGTIEFYEGSMRSSCIEVKQWNTENNASKMLIAKIRLKADENETIWKNISNPQWRTPNNQIPGDGNFRCFFGPNSNDFFISCNDSVIFGSIGFILALITVFVVTTVFSFKRHNANVNLLKNALRNKSVITNRLQSYEVPRDNIEMNWEIGKGSFGKVFGGFLKMYGETWIEVAIKHLKCDATAEDENDFLCEAKTMASFDHRNIVKLIAVCTVGTPILIVMELMLLEDLKKFLITRRHLLDNPEGTQLKSITRKGLTTMAHDVAMALSYLASKQFVHRDVASRNCLVNSHGVVKLADFGMTRYVFSKGEYLTNRKALFPVRWMAPESLNCGTFTTMSDIWSYGILLYEIVTFGCMPYNNIKDLVYVKEFIVNGNIIRLPSAIDPQLKSLIEQCWSYDASQRPTAADFVMYLADRPTLLHPCLEELPDGRVFGSAGTGDTPTILVGDSTGLDTTGPSTLGHTVLHERKDSGYEPSESPTECS